MRGHGTDNPTGRAGWPGNTDWLGKTDFTPAKRDFGGAKRDSTPAQDGFFPLEGSRLHHSHTPLIYSKIWWNMLPFHTGSRFTRCAKIVHHTCTNRTEQARKTTSRTLRGFTGETCRERCIFHSILFKVRRLERREGVKHTAWRFV